MKKCPLSGDPCVNPPIIYVTDIAKNGVVQSYPLCNQCGVPFLSQAMQSIDPSVNVQETNAALQTLIQSGPLKAAIPEWATDESCPSCKCTIKYILEKGRMGCPECYETFKKYVAAVVLDFQGGKTHTGKVPKKANAQVKEARIKRLKEEMTEAVKVENYERAAQLRDDIKQLEES